MPRPSSPSHHHRAAPRRLQRAGRQKGLARGLENWSFLLLSLSALRFAWGVGTDGEPRWLLGEGLFGVGNQAALGAVLAACGIMVALFGGLSRALRALPKLLLVATLHLLLLAVFPTDWLLARFESDEVLFRVSTNLPRYALTIDDGLDPVATPLILDTLAEHDARATFFVLGESLADQTRLVRRIRAEGHELANHQMTDTATVALTPAALERQIRQAHAALGATGRSDWFRPGGGIVTERCKTVCKSLGLRIALGSVFPFDSHQTSVRFSAAFLASRIKPGAIVILHDGAGRGERTALVLDRVLDQLNQRGLQAVTLTELAAGSTKESP
ncbi:polysaccharide deacetylase family protein [Botrimarina hoheduenensis]|nr:polysaccharide deacetylase family protein [Botrimarina hoheduenensis]